MAERNVDLDADVRPIMIPEGADPIDYNRTAENLGKTHLDFPRVWGDWEDDEC